MKQWHFYERVYRRWVVLTIGPYNDLIKDLAEAGYKYTAGLEDANGMCIDLTPDNNSTGQNCTFVWLKEYDSATLVHEITHLVMMCFNQVLIPISSENTEAFAFYSEYWYREFTKARRKYPNGKTPSEAKLIERLPTKPQVRERIT